MKRPLRTALVAGAAVLSAGPAAQQNREGGEVEVLLVHGSVYMIAGAGGNIAVSVGKDGVLLVDSGAAPMADKVLAAICYPHTRLPEAQLLERVRLLPASDRVALMQAYVGERVNRRHKPGRAFERTGYRFDVLGDSRRQPDALTAAN